MINDLQRMGGISALIEAAVYMVGFGVFIFLLDSSGYVGPVQQIAFLADNKTTLYTANLLIYVVFGVFLVVLAIALHERLKVGARAVVQTATALGLIWAGLVIASGMISNIGMDVVIDMSEGDTDQAAIVWVAISSVQEALGGGNEIVGGLWVLLISCAALIAREFPKALNYLGAGIGLAGILTAVPTLTVLTDVFGLGQIIWFAWLGIVMLQRSPRTT